MTRSLRLAALVLATVLGSAWPVQGGILDILEELSGPGKFKTDGLANFVTTWCLNRTLTQADTSNRPCLYVDYHRLINKKDDNFYANNRQAGKELRLTAFALGLAFQPWDNVPVDIGGEFGGLHFHTSDTNGVTDTTKWTVAPRVQVKPLLALPVFRDAAQHRLARKRVSVLKFYVRRLVILGTLNGARDFGATGSTYQVKNDGVWSYGFLIDLTELRRP